MRCRRGKWEERGPAGKSRALCEEETGEGGRSVRARGDGRETEIGERGRRVDNGGMERRKGRREKKN